MRGMIAGALAVLAALATTAPSNAVPSQDPSPSGSPVASTSSSPTSTPSSSPTSTTVSPSPRPSRYRGAVLAVGDSVMLGAKRCLEATDVIVDSLGNRRISAGIDLLKGLGAKVPARVVVHLGTNGGIEPQDLDRLMKALGPARRVFLLTIQLPDNTTRYTFEDRTNAAIARIPYRYPNAYVLDWNRLSDRVDGLVGGDHIHLTNRGCDAYANLVNSLVRSPLE